MNAIRENSGQKSDCACLQPEELQSLLTMAAEAVNSFCLNSDHCVKRLGEVEDQIEEASAVAAIRMLRFQLTECLDRLRREAMHQRKQMAGGSGAASHATGNRARNKKRGLPIARQRRAQRPRSPRQRRAGFR